MATAQTAIDQMRIQLSEKDKVNSRWDDDPDLLFYLNQGRREFAKKSESIKALFQQTTVQGATVVGQNRFARYVLDPTVWEIDNIFWQDFEVEAQGRTEWEEMMGARAPSEQGVPYIYSRIGDSIDLFFAPNAAKTLDVYASILTTSLTLNQAETELKEDQLQAAVDYATGLALVDDGRSDEASVYIDKFKASVKIWKKKIHRKGPRQVNVVRDFWHG